MKVVVTDVSVLFDLYKIRILNEFFVLGLEVYITDIVYNQICHPDQKEAFGFFVKKGKLIILPLSSEDIQVAQHFKTKRIMHSLADKTILSKAIELRAIMLTCDKKLRMEAEEHSINVRGSIWVIEQLVEHEIINPTRAISLLEELKMINGRLPVDLIDKLIRRWKK